MICLPPHAHISWWAVVRAGGRRVGFQATYRAGLFRENVFYFGQGGRCQNLKGRRPNMARWKHVSELPLPYNIGTHASLGRLRKSCEDDFQRESQYLSNMTTSQQTVAHTTTQGKLHPTATAAGGVV